MNDTQSGAKKHVAQCTASVWSAELLDEFSCASAFPISVKTAKFCPAELLAPHVWTWAIEFHLIRRCKRIQLVKLNAMCPENGY